MNSHLLARVSVRLLAAGCLCVLQQQGAFSAQDPICAQVRIQIDQQAVLTRTAFRATLRIDNATNSSLEQFLVNLDIRTADGQHANHLFEGLDQATLTGFTVGAYDGSGVIPGASTGGKPSQATIEWLILPQDLAAPTADPVRYTFGGEVSHTQSGIPVDVPLYPVDIDVYPDANLFLKYYLQSPVYGDSPFTRPIEPAEPFSLGLMIYNDGPGAARNFRITSGQPAIIENMHGLLVAFQLIGAQIGKLPAIPCLTLDFGDIAPGDTTVGRWLMTSSLTGFFSDYDVTFQHVNPLGTDSLLSADVSLIGGVDIFELDHTVRVGGSLDDGNPDFLVRDPAAVQPLVGPDCDPNSIADPPPNALHLSDGLTVLPVWPIDEASFDAPPVSRDIVVMMTVDCAVPGWNVIRVEDPGQDSFVLASVERVLPTGGRMPIPVGAPGDIGNAWTTHRWVPLNCSTPTLQHRMHVLDQLPRTGQYTYELTYWPDLRVASVRTGKVIPPLVMRSNVRSLVVEFSALTNLPTLIANGQIIDAVQIVERLSRGGAQPLGLSLDRFVWDSDTLTLTIDLTEDGPGNSPVTQLTDGNYELRLVTDLIRLPGPSLPLMDTDGTPDGVFRFGDDAGDGFFRFRGDCDGDRSVDVDDVNVILAVFGLKKTNAGYDPNADTYPNGFVGLRDLWMLRRNWMRTLPFY